MTQAPPRLEVQNLVRSFGGQAVVDDVSFAVPAGQVACLLGPSGCGKSTTLRIVAGVDMQDSGKIFVDGSLVCDTVFRVPPERRHIGMMFQDFALFPHLSVAENVAFGLGGGARANRGRVGELLERVRMSRHMDSYPHALSGGEQQRVALARALAPNPRILLMDEPFSGLDERLRDGIRDETLALLKEEGTAVLLVTHEPHEAMRMADQILLMRHGRIVQRGAPYNLYNAPVDGCERADRHRARGADRHAVRRFPDARGAGRDARRHRDPAAASADRLRPLGQGAGADAGTWHRGAWGGAAGALPRARIAGRVPHGP